MSAGTTPQLGIIQSWQVRFVTRYAWLIIIAALLLTGISLYYIKDHLGVNNNSAEMLSPDLPFQQNTKRLELAFPQDANTMIFVVDAPTTEETAIAAQKLSTRLNNSHAHFKSSYIPEDNAFFRQQALLYLSPSALEKLADNLSDAQPFIGYLAQNYHLTGLFELLTQALTTKDSVISQSLPELLTGISTTIKATAQGQHAPVSWQKILSPNSLTNKTRRIVIAKPKKNFSEIMPAAAAVEQARNIIRKIQTQMPGVIIRVTGETALEHEELESIGQGAVLSGIGSFILVCILLFRCLRSIKLLLATLATLIMGLILTAGFAAVAIGHLNVISISFAALYIGLGVDFAIHMNLHYRDAMVRHHNSQIAVKNALHSVGFSLFLCALTTSIGFFAFVPTDYKGVSELGLISGASMFIALFLSLIVLPALLSLLRFKKIQAIQQKTAANFLQTLPFRYKKTIRISSILLACACLFAIPYVTFDSNPVNMRNPNAETVITFKDLLQSKTESPYALYALSNSLAKTRELSKQLQALPTVDSTLTLEDLVPDKQAEKLSIIEDLAMIFALQLDSFKQVPAPSDSVAVLHRFQKTLHQQLANPSNAIAPAILNELNTNINIFMAAVQQSPQPDLLKKSLDNSILGLLPYTISTLNQSLHAEPFTLADLPRYIREQWLSPTGIYRIMILPAQDLNIPANLKRFALEVQSIDPTATGLPVADLASGQAVVAAFQQAFTSSLIIITVLLLIILRSLKKTLLVIGPLLLAGLLTCSVNVLLGIPFNFANIIALPLLLGMGVDSGIHIMHCLHEHLDDKQHLLQTSTARGVMFSSMTTMSSFVSLALIPHFGIASMGITLAVGISFTLIATLIVLPAFSNKSIQL